MSKRVFQFYLQPGVIETNTDSDYLKSRGLTDEQINERQQQMEAHYVSEIHLERQWRDRELSLTDRLMFEDSTYKGQVVKYSDYYQELLAYRQALRDYDLKYQPRPERPGWFNPSENH